MPRYPQEGLFERLEGGAFRAYNAVITGDVTLGEDVGIWFGCVLRGDDAPLHIGARTNIQDLSMVHADTGVPNVIGDDVTVGHRCVLHGATDAAAVRPASDGVGGRARTIRQSGTITANANTPNQRYAPRQPIVSWA